MCGAFTMIPGVVGSQRVSSVDATSPTITSDDAFNTPEDEVLAHTLTADEDVTWTITGGADAAEFEIVGDMLRWESNGTQSAGVFQVEVTATDLAENEAVQTITVTVVSAWTTIFDATTGTMSGDVNVGGTNSRLYIDPASTTGGSDTKIRVTFMAAAAADRVIENAAIGKGGGTPPIINWDGTPTVFAFGGNPGVTIPAGTEVTSDEATVVTPFTAFDVLLVAVDDGATSQTRGRAETSAALFGKTLSGNDTTNASITSGVGQYEVYTSGESSGVSKIEVKS